MTHQLPGGNDTYYMHSLVRRSDTAFHLDHLFHICMVLEGHCQIQYNAMTRHIKTNDIFFFPANTPYMLHTLSEQVLLYHIQVTPAFFREFSPSLTTFGYDIFHVPCNDSDPNYRQLCHLLSDMVFSALSGNASGSLRQFSLICRLLLFLGEEFGHSAAQTAADLDYIQVRITQAMAYITDNYMNKITLESISSEFGLHPQYFSAFFKKHFHMPFTNYLILYRVNQSLFYLKNTQHSILEIAECCGFHSHKSYCSAFKKYYGMLPSQYRRQHQQPASSPTAGPSNAPAASGPATETLGQAALLTHFQYLRSYWTQPEAMERNALPRPLFLEMDLTRTHIISTDRRLRILSIGSGVSLLEKRVCDQLAKAAKECHFTHIHFRDVFSDLLKVYTQQSNGEPFYYWERLDQVIGTIHQLGLRPFIEIGYMPRALASSRSELDMGYHPNMSPPKSQKHWSSLIRAFLEHYINIYGMEVRQWRFDFWNSANIQLTNGYWHDSREQFFNLYRLTWNAFMEVDPALLLGSPNFSLPDGMDWYEAFFDYCQQYKIKPAFLTLHMYSCMDNMETAQGIFPTPPTTYNYLSLTNTEYPLNLLRFLKDMLARHHMAGLPLITTEWNITFYLQDLIRDTAFMAPYIAHTYLITRELTQGLAYFALSDSNDQTRPSQLCFPGASGLIDNHSIPKPAYNAFVLLHRLDKDILACQPPYIVTKSSRGFHILIYNLAEYDNDLKKSKLDFMSDIHRYQVFAATQPLAFHGRFTVTPGTYVIRKYTIDRDHGCSFDAWQAMGSPEMLTNEICQYLKAAAMPKFHCETRSHTETLTLEGEVAPHGVLLMEIEKMGE